MKNFYISEKDSLSQLIKSLSPCNSDEEIHILLSNGEHKGAEHERIFYNFANPLIIESESGNAGNCALRAENCESYHKDTENRAILTFGENCTSVVLKNFTIENTHLKTCDDVSLGNQAEAICFHCQKGKLYCEGMNFLSRQDTIHVKGFSHFKNCYVTGDVDFIWGYCDTSVFENCTIHTRKDNRGDDRPAYVLQSRALNGKPGFIFVDCDFTADNRGEKAEIFIGRSQGTGKPNSIDRWDSIALINCKISELYDKALWTDEDGSRAVYPEKGSALYGWRQFGTKIAKSNGKLLPYKEALQEKHGYTMTEKEAMGLIELTLGK